MNNPDFNPEFDNLDSLMSALVQIGFEHEDCRLAIQNGKLTADEIIDWITAGKPVAQPNSQPVLKLNTQAVPAPTIPNSDSQETSRASGFSADASSYGLERTLPVGEDAVPLVSRINRNEEQRQFKIRYEEKQREEAKKQATQERLAKKKAHEDALRRIQEDRENFRLRSMPSASQPAPGGPGTSAEPEPTSQSKPLADSDNSVLQIRLPDGRCLKQSFPTTTLLREVKEFIENGYYKGKPVILLQPFPRMEFGGTDMERSLKELGIVPSGSLVVKKPDVLSAMQTDPTTKEEGDTSSVDPPKKIKPSDPVPPPQNVLQPPVAASQPQPPGHHWGSGQAMVNDPQLQDPIDGSSQEEDDMECGSDEDSSVQGPPPPPQHQHQPAQLPAFPPLNPAFPGGGGGFGGFGGGGGGGGGNFGQVQHDWGFGNVLAGPFLDNVALPHHNQDPRTLAGEAASQRSSVQPQEPSRSSSETVVTQPEVSSLRDLVLHVVAVQICDPRKPFAGLHGIPENLASIVLKTLVKERLLKPASLEKFISCRMQKIVLDSYTYCTNELIRGIRHHTFLKHLSLKSCSLITEKGLQSLAGLKFLKHLNLTGCVKIDDTCFPIFSAISSLVVLVLDGTSVTDSGVASYASTTPENLTMLDLSRTQVTEAIFPPLSNMPSLNSLLLEQTKIKSLAGIQGLVKLVRLNVANTEIVTESMICLAGISSLASLNCASTPNINGDAAVRYLSSLPLREFHLPNRLTTTDVAFQHITGMKLTGLDLNNFIYITDLSMPYVGQLRQLKKLYLSNTKITDVGIKCLEGLLDLEELDLDRTAVTNAIAGTIRVFTRLRELSLCKTGITNGFLKTEAVNQCIELTRLNISQTKISDKGVVCLRLPHLTTLKIDSTHVTLESFETVRSGCPLLGMFTYKTLLPLPRETSELD